VYDTFPEIAQKRSLKEGTIWEHITKLIAYGNISIYKTLKKEELQEIQKAFSSPEEALKAVKERLSHRFSYHQIQCVQAHIQHLKRNLRIWSFFLWYQKKHCSRKCYKNKKQRDVCTMNMKIFAARNPQLEMKKMEFLDLFNEHMHICVLAEDEKRRYITWEEFKKMKSK